MTSFVSPTAAPRLTWLWIITALAGGLAVGWLDRSATEVQGPLLLLMATAFLLAIPRGAPAWAIAIATAVGLPLAHLIGGALGDHGGASWGMLVVAVPATLAAYVGAATGAVMQRASALVDRRFLLGGALLACSALGAGPVYATLAVRGQPFPWFVATIWQLVSLVGWAVATPLVLRLWRSLHPDDEVAIASRELLMHVAAVLAIALVHAALVATGTTVLFIPLGPASVVSVIGWAIVAYLPLDALTYVAVTGVAYATDADRRARDAMTRESAARGELAAARLAGLRAQLRPHFLFNALNTASVMATRGDAEGTRRVLAGLGELLRYVMRDADDQGAQDSAMVALQDEIAFVDQYLAIERERFPERLHSTLDIAPDAQTARVPALLLQPFVENAIKHGVGGRIGAGLVSVKAWRDGDTLRLVIEDDGPGPGATPNGERGIGLANTRSRLAVLYGAQATVSLEPRTGGGAVARITLPFRVA